MSSKVPFGKLVLAAQLPPTTGEYFFVHSGTGSNGNSGKSPERPFSTIDYAVGRCTANKGDVIVVMPGHTETVTAAGGLDLDVAGISVIGIGSGSDRPTVNFTTATTADMDVDAANVTIKNLLFTGGIDALAGPIDINAADCTMEDCEFRDVTGQTTDWIVVATSTAHRGRLIRPVVRGAAADGGDTWLSIREAVDGWVVEDAWVDGNFDEGCIENVGTACTNLSVYGASKPAFFRNRGSEDLIVSLLATTTGNVGPNINARLADNAANITEAFAGADMQFFQPINIVNLDGESSMQTNITASVDE
jgi:hypothetical protein